MEFEKEIEERTWVFPFYGSLLSVLTEFTSVVSYYFKTMPTLISGCGIFPSSAFSITHVLFLRKRVILRACTPVQTQACHLTCHCFLVAEEFTVDVLNVSLIFTTHPALTNIFILPGIPHLRKKEGKIPQIKNLGSIMCIMKTFLTDRMMP